jgi:hypothetical protein
MIFTTFFVNRFFRTRYEKKVISRYNTQKKLESNYLNVYSISLRSLKKCFFFKYIY